MVHVQSTLYHLLNPYRWRMVIGLDRGLDECLRTSFLSRQSNRANVSVNELQELLQDLCAKPDVWLPVWHEGSLIGTNPVIHPRKIARRKPSSTRQDRDFVLEFIQETIGFAS